MKISQLERGGNGVRFRVVNQTFFLLDRLGSPFAAAITRPSPLAYSVLGRLSRFQTTCCNKSSLGLDIESGQLNLFDCASAQSFCARRACEGFLR
jgi:hypothetical protein